MFEGCEQERDKTVNAEIIEFVSEKCYCCWGWIIKVEKDTIKAGDLPDPSLIGYDIKSPIPVSIEIGKKTEDCSELNRYNYYEIISLDLK